MYKLYGIPASLYTAKVRSYLRKQRIVFTEYGVNSAHYQKTIIPVIGRFIMPVLEAPDGALIQDGADIIDYLEQHEKPVMAAQSDVAIVNIVSYLFELFGGEGMLRPAMHYRWNFDQQLDFIKNDFACGMAAPDTDQVEVDALFEMASGAMQAAKKAFGVTDESIPLIEQSYKEFLALFSAHLKQYPYLLGGRPTYGDYGLVASLYAHLGRDPVPAMLTRTTAPQVSRWVERMHAPEIVEVEYQDTGTDLMESSEIPVTLKALMTYISEEYLPELTAHVDFANKWLASKKDLKIGTNGLDNPTTRMIGKASFEWRGITLSTAVMPYRFYLLQRIQAVFEHASDADKTAIKALFEETGLAAVLTLKTDRSVKRVNHLEVWGEKR
jgi:glutathione S-transferase